MEFLVLPTHSRKRNPYSYPTQEDHRSDARRKFLENDGSSVICSMDPLYGVCVAGVVVKMRMWWSFKNQPQQ